MARLPDTLLDVVHARVLDGLADIAGEGPLAQEIARRVIAYLRNTSETTVDVEEDGTT